MLSEIHRTMLRQRISSSYILRPVTLDLRIWFKFMSSQSRQPNMGRGQTCIAGASLSKVYAAKLGCIHKMGDVRDYSAQNGEGGDAIPRFWERRGTTLVLVYMRYGRQKKICMDRHGDRGELEVLHKYVA